MAESKTGTKIDAIIQMTPGISNVKRALRIVKEKDQYKLLKYYSHHQSLNEHQKKELN